MFAELEQAIASENYDLAQTIIKDLDKQKVDQLWLKYYQTLIIEKQDQLTQAEKDYRQIIKDSVYPDQKLINLIRNGIERIVELQEERKETKKEEFTKLEDSEELAVLIFEDVSLEEKKQLAPTLAKIMGIDRYTATLQIPTRSWRLYKTGNLGELNYYQAELSQAGLPCFCYPIKQINQMMVYQVKYIESDRQNLIFYCEDDQEKEPIIKLKFTEIDNFVTGMIPLFELTVNLDARNKIKKKQSTLDYIAFDDLHSISHNAIFRLNDRSYEFEKDQNIQGQSTTTKEKWQDLENNLKDKIKPEKVWSNFTLFAEGVVQFPEMLRQIKSHVHLFRREDTVWDEAFQLYSGLVFLQSLSGS